MFINGSLCNHLDRDRWVTFEGNNLDLLGRIDEIKPCTTSVGLIGDKFRILTKVYLVFIVAPCILI